MQPAANEYGPQALEVLSGCEHIRRRPGMYIGSTDENGLRHLVRELVEGGLIEFLEGHGDRIKVELLRDGGIRVQDNGRDLPFSKLGSRLSEYHGLLRPIQKLQRTALVQSLYGNLGFCIVAALSSRCEITGTENGTLWQLNGAREEWAEPVQVKPCRTSGCTVTFWPDPEIFKGNLALSQDWLRNELQKLAFLHPGLGLSWIDRRGCQRQGEKYCSREGLSGFVAWLNQGQEVVHSEICQGECELNGNRAGFAVQWMVNAKGPNIRSYANDCQTRSGGTHEQGLTRALIRTLRHAGSLRRKDDIRPEDCCAGLTAVLSLWLTEPQFCGATRERLINPEAKNLVANLVEDSLATFLTENPDQAAAIFQHIRDAAEMRRNATVRLKRKK